MSAAVRTTSARVAGRTVPATGDARQVRWQTAAVFFLAAAAYVLLMSGHIYARDEETLFQMAESIARSGTARVSAVVWGIVAANLPPVGGRIATSYAPGQPLLAVPLYWLGAAIGQAGGEATAVFLSRFVVLAFNAFVTAGTVALLFRFARALGYRARVGAALAVCYGAATFALVQARTFFAEPLTALLVLLAFFLLDRASDAHHSQRRQAATAALSGFAIAAALAVKIHAALFLPALALYLLLAALPRRGSIPDRAMWRDLGLRGVAWVAGMAPLALALMVYNRALYGRPLTTGYGDSPNIFTTPLLTGLYGLLLSSGKGIIWYAPPLVFALIGLPAFLRRFPRVAAAILVAGATNLLFYARLEFWHGDGAWGPRYLLIVLPWLLLAALPTLAWLLAPQRGAAVVMARVAATLLILAGIAVQSLAIAVSFDIPILTTPEQARFFTPSQSPLTVSVRTALARARTWWREARPPPDTLVLRDGFFPAEGESGAPFPRWTGGEAVATLHPANGGATLRVKLTYFDHRPAPLRATATPVTVAIGATPLTPVDRVPVAPANEGFILAYDVPPALLRQAGNRLVIRVPTWNPAAAGVSDRDADLGIFVNNLEVFADGVPLAVRAVTVLPGVPDTPRQVWLWANYPQYPHLLDWWPVLLADARLPGRLAAAIAGGLLGAATLLLLGGALSLRRAWRLGRE